MKKISLLLLTTICFISSYAQKEVPSKLLKNIVVVNDEFTGERIYSNKTEWYCRLYVKSLNDSTQIRLQFTVGNGEHPANVKKIQLASKGEIKEVAFTPEEYSSAYKTERRSKQTLLPSGLSTLSFYDHTFNRETIDVDAMPYLEYMNIVKDNKVLKIKFTGDKEWITEVKPALIDNLKAILDIYNFLITNQ